MECGEIHFSPHLPEPYVSWYNAGDGSDTGGVNTWWSDRFINANGAFIGEKKAEKVKEEIRKQFPMALH